MKTILNAVAIGLVAMLLVLRAGPAAGEDARAPRGDSPDYLKIVKTFADTLLDKGLDVYGPKKTALWCGVIKLDDMSVPQDPKEIPLRKGERSQDRCVGGCNLHQDVSSLYAFRALSKITGVPRYEKAVNDYVRDFIAVAQNPKSGLLAWGEHMYYEVYGDVVHKEYGRTGASHELVEWTPPWDILWEVDPKSTARAIEGLKYHFYGADAAKTGWLYNRHAGWSGSYSNPGKSQPWIKHSALFAYSYAFLYAKTREQAWKDREIATGELYWNNRDPKTNLTASCLTSTGGKQGNIFSEINSVPIFAYFLLKAGYADPGATALREHALAVLKAYLKYSGDPEAKTYRKKLNLDGTPYSEITSQTINAPKSGGKKVQENPWTIGYGSESSGLLRLGRIAAYVARTEKDKECLDAAARVAGILKSASLPENFTPEEIGFGIHLNLDLYGLTNDKACLAEADRLAKIAVEKLFKNGLIQSIPASNIYEAKSGAGDLASSLLRLSLRLSAKPDPAGVYDWSF
ncbi:MAG: hypothetical protein NTX50_19380 [Candidatus Sumerlaeota bacterium]|nr:hypothetical protein [Candidatus Sumerlaeota bacterium]